MSPWIELGVGMLGFFPVATVAEQWAVKCGPRMNCYIFEWEASCAKVYLTAGHAALSDLIG